MRAVIAALLLVLCAFDATAVPEQTVHVLFDATYSMGLPSGQMSRMERFLSLLPDVIARVGGNVIELSVLNGDSSLQSLGLMSGADAVVEEMNRRTVNGRGSPTRALAELARDVQALRESPTILLVTDAEDLRPALAVPRTPGTLHLYTLQERTPAAERTVDALDSIVDTLFLASEDGRLRALSRETRRTQHNDAADAGRTAIPSEPTRARLLPVLMTILSAVALLALLVLLIHLGLEYRRFLRIRSRIRAYNSVAPMITLAVRGGSGHDDVETRTFPISIGFAPTHTVCLPESVASDRFTASDRLMIERTPDGFRFTSTTDLRISGMPRREGPINSGMQIRLGRARLTISGIEQRKVKREPRPYHYEKLPLAGIFSAAVVILFFGGVALGSPRRPVQANEIASGEEIPPSAETHRRTPVGHGSGSSVVLSSQRVWGAPSPGKPRTFVGLETVQWFDADFMAVHAHPDDEALDFGSLLATLTASGRRGVQVLLTDGESGQDLHPDRPSRPGYPNEELRGPELARVRVGETQSSLGWLGVDHYVRLGYRNHPYNSLLDEMSPAETLSVWGGADQVAADLATLIAGYTPALLISPDRPSEVIEHFEHDATGIATALAVEIARSQGFAPLVHLVSIDPLQVQLMPDHYILPAWNVRAHGVSVSARDRQIAALDAHVTQLDAHVNGVETRMGLLHEFYRVMSGAGHVDTLIPELVSSAQVP